MSGFTNQRPNSDSEKFHAPKRQTPLPPPNKNKE